MEYEEDLKKLESNVEKMLRNLDSAQEDKMRMRADIARLEEDKKELEERIKILKEEKKSIHQRVSTLLGSIEEWEKSAAQETVLPSSVDVSGKGLVEPTQGLFTGN